MQDEILQMYGPAVLIVWSVGVIGGGGSLPCLLINLIRIILIGLLAQQRDSGRIVDETDTTWEPDAQYGDADLDNE